MPESSASTRPVADTLGTLGHYRDPLWGTDLELTPLEQDLLRCWWVRRLALVAHAGAASVVTTQSYSRLEHALGLLSLVAHVDPGNMLARAAALLHDIGHPPLSHTLEGVRGLDHHLIGEARLDELDDVLQRHGASAADIRDVLNGLLPSPLRRQQGLRLDHLDSFLRSGRAHGRYTEPASDVLHRLRLVDGVVDTDPATAKLLCGLITAEALALTSPVNLVATGVVWDLGRRLLEPMTDPNVRSVATLTDPEFWALLLAHPQLSPVLRLFLEDPGAWSIAPDDGRPLSGTLGTTFRFRPRRLYLDLPSCNGQPLPTDTLPVELAVGPRSFLITPSGSRTTSG